MGKSVLSLTAEVKRVSIVVSHQQPSWTQKTLPLSYCTTPFYTYLVFLDLSICKTVCTVLCFISGSVTCYGPGAGCGCVFRTTKRTPAKSNPAHCSDCKSNLSMMCSWPAATTSVTTEFGTLCRTIHLGVIWLKCTFWAFCSQFGNFKLLHSLDRCFLVVWIVYWLTLHTLMWHVCVTQL